MTLKNPWRKGFALPVLASRADVDYARLEVDNGNTAFNEGKQFRISHEYSIAETPIVLRFESPVDFILQLQDLTCDLEAVKFTAFRSTQGVESGVFSDVVPIYRVNLTAETKDLDPLAGITTGGVFTPTVGQVSVETIRLRAGGGHAKSQTVTGAVGDERGLSAGIYYLQIERLDGNTNAEGVYSLVWEEKRNV